MLRTLSQLDQLHIVGQGGASNDFSLKYDPSAPENIIDPSMKEFLEFFGISSSEFPALEIYQKKREAPPSPSSGVPGTREGDAEIVKQTNAQTVVKSVHSNSVDIIFSNSK